MEYRFHSALRGFNREEVAAYIEYMIKQHQTEISQLNADLELERKNTAARSEGELAGAMKDLAQKNAACDRLTEELAGEKEKVTQLEEKLAEVESAGEAWEKTLAEKDETISSQEARIAQLEEALSEKDGQLEEALSQKDEEPEEAENDPAAEEAQEKAEELEETLAQLKQTLSQKEEAIEKLNQELEEKKEAVDELEKTVSAQQRTIAEASDTPPSRVYSVHTRNGEQDRLLAEKDRTIADLQEKLNKKEGNRIEALERRARVRAERVDQQSDFIVAQTTQSLEETSTQVESAVHEVLSKLEALQKVLAESRERIQGAGMDGEDK